MQPASAQSWPAGYARESTASQMRLMEHLSLHLEERGLAVADLTVQVAGLLGTRHHPVPQALRPLGVGALFLVDRMTGAG